MARSITYREAINEAIAQEMARDERVIVMGEDNAGGQGSPGEDDAWGGVLGVTKGLYGKFPGRVLDTPISESAFIGAALASWTTRSMSAPTSASTSSSWASLSWPDSVTRARKRLRQSRFARALATSSAR